VHRRRRIDVSARDDGFLSLAEREPVRFVPERGAWHGRPLTRLAACVVLPSIACAVLGGLAVFLAASPWALAACLLGILVSIACAVARAGVVVAAPLRHWVEISWAQAHPNERREFAPPGRDPFDALARSLDAMTESLQGRISRTEELLHAEEQSASDLQRQYALMQLLRDLATLGQVGGTFEQAMEQALHQVGNYLDWPVGRLVWVGQDASWRSHWFVRDEAGLRRFTSESERLGAEAPGQGLVGKALASNLPHWVSDLSRLPGWPRADAARACGLRTGVAIPVSGPGSRAAYLEFFSRHRIEPTLEMLELVEAIREELWRVAGHFDALAAGGPEVAAPAASAASPDQRLREAV
jgi:hypothetical protein